MGTSSFRKIEIFRGGNRLEHLRDKVTVVILTLNEAEAIGPLIEEVKACGYRNILVVDGYSTDGTDKIASSLGAEVVRQHGKGKAGAILTAREIVKTPYFIVMDGDYTYDPKDIDRFLPFMGGYDHIIGYRPKGCPHISRTHRLGNWILTKAFNLLMGSNVPDVCCGMYMLRTEKAKELMLERHGFVVDQEIAAQTLLDGKVTYVPINYRKRLGKAKAPTWRQGFRALWTIFQLGREYNPVLLFSALASLAIIPGFIILGWFMYRYLFFGVIHSTYLLLSIMLVILGALGLAVSTIAVLLRRMERKIIDLIKKA
jgi:dolichol-phosphate mannosyltransferase